MPIDYEALANAFLIVVTGLLAYFGVSRGIKKPPEEAQDKPPQSLELKMAMIDNRAVEALATSVETVNDTLQETNKLIRRELQEREIEEEVERRLKSRM